MAKKIEGWNLLGAWSFIIGLIIAVIVGIFSTSAIPGSVATTVLLILGLIVGILNVTDKEIIPFLVACITLIIVGSTGIVPFAWLQRILSNIVVFVIPAALVGSLKAIYVIASNK
jgi:hypothetical protein